MLKLHVNLTFLPPAEVIECYALALSAFNPGSGSLWATTITPFGRIGPPFVGMWVSAAVPSSSLLDTEEADRDGASEMRQVSESCERTGPSQTYPKGEPSTSRPGKDLTTLSPHVSAELDFRYRSWTPIHDYMRA